MKKFMAGLLFGMLLCCTACGNIAKQYDANTLIITDENTITDVSVEDYTGLDIAEEELEAYIEEQIAGYQQTQTVTLDTLSVSGDSAKLVMTYQDMDIYNAVNGTDYQLLAADQWKYKKEEIKGMVSPDAGALEQEAVTALLAEQHTQVLLLTGETDVVISKTLLAYKGAEYENGILHGKDGSIIIYK